MNILQAISLVVVFLRLALASSQDICPVYFCFDNLSKLECQPVTKVLLDQLIIKDNPKLLEWANCQEVNRTENPSEDLIVWLSYKNNDLSEIPNHQFENYGNLNVLMLNDNKIQLSDNETFQGLSRLEFLHLQNNWISNLPEGIFNPLYNIAWIDLSNNRIASLPANIISYYTSLKGLDLSKNPLTTIVIPIGHPITAIVCLFLNDCAQLKEVELGIDVSNLTLDNSGVESVKISGNIDNIQAENSKITHLNMRNAVLTGFIIDVLCPIRSLEWLDLSSTSLDDIRLFNRGLYSECLLPNLRFLNLSNNLIGSLPMGSPLFASHLTTQDLSFNRLKNLYLDSLKEALFNIGSLPMGSPLFASHLITLDLSFNRLENLSLDSLKEAHSLQRLYLNNNHLTSFDIRSLIHQFKNLTDFTFHDNSFNDTFNDAMTKYWNRRQMEAAPKNQKDVDEEQKNGFMWIWITLHIIVALLMAVIWLVLKKRGNGWQPL